MDWTYIFQSVYRKSAKWNGSTLTASQINRQQMMQRSISRSIFMCYFRKCVSSFLFYYLLSSCILSSIKNTNTNNVVWQHCQNIIFFGNILAEKKILVKNYIKECIVSFVSIVLNTPQNLVRIVTQTNGHWIWRKKPYTTLNPSFS